MSATELYSLRLYTGPPFVKYNSVLRGAGSAESVPFLHRNFVEVCQGNTYASTLHVLSAAILKLSKITPAIKVYRAPGGALPESFWQRDQRSGVQGGLELAFMSTTSDKEEAMKYARRAPGMILFEIEQVRVHARAGTPCPCPCPRPRPCACILSCALHVRDPLRARAGLCRARRLHLLPLAVPRGGGGVAAALHGPRGLLEPHRGRRRRRAVAAEPLDRVRGLRPADRRRRPRVARGAAPAPAAGRPARPAEGRGRAREGRAGAKHARAGAKPGPGGARVAEALRGASLLGARASRGGPIAAARRTGGGGLPAQADAHAERGGAECPRATRQDCRGGQARRRAQAGAHRDGAGRGADARGDRAPGAGEHAAARAAQSRKEAVGGARGVDEGAGAGEHPAPARVGGDQLPAAAAAQPRDRAREDPQQHAAGRRARGGRAIPDPGGCVAQDAKEHRGPRRDQSHGGDRASERRRAARRPAGAVEGGQDGRGRRRDGRGVRAPRRAVHAPCNRT